MLTRLGAAGRRLAATPPWTNVYGLARTLLALGTLGTLLFSSTSTLFRPASGAPDYPHCEGLAHAGLFCVVPSGNLEAGRLIAIGILLVVASGWRPRLTAIPHWWVTFGLQANATIPDGGDQVAAVVTLLLLPIALSDGRTWHWGFARAEPQGHSLPADRLAIMTLVAWSAALVIRIQVAGVYLQSSVAKLAVPEWADGTALYYWLRNPAFGAPAWMSGLTDAVTRNPVGVQILTWGPLIIEFAIVLGLIARRSVRPYLLLAGISLHVSIGVLMGLWSFALAMIACLILLLRPLDLPFPLARLANHPAWRRLGSRLLRATPAR